MNAKTIRKQTKMSEPPALPLLYKSLEPLNSRAHADIAFRRSERYDFAAAATAVPIALAEAARAQAHYPIVFSRGEKPLPIAVTGLPESGNRFIDEDGRWKEGAYVPAYVRRYPFMLARTDPASDTLSLCFDPTAECVETAAGKGNLFDGDEPSAIVQPILGLCKEVEAAARQTEAVMEKLIALELLTDGQAQVREGERPLANFGGFQIVSEEKLHKLADGDIAALLRSGAMPLIYAHLLSLRHLTELAPRSRLV